MNLILAGAAFLGALLLGPDDPKAPVETRASAPAQQPAQQHAQKTQPAGKTEQAPQQRPEDRGWMTRELSVDRKTGEATEISVIGFAD